MGAAAGPCPAWRPRAPGPGLALTPWPPPAGERGRPGKGAGRGRGRPGQSAEGGLGAGVEPHQGRGPGPHPRPRTVPRGRAGRQARGTGRAPVGGIQRWAWSGCSGGCRRRLPRLWPGESPGTLRSTSGVTGHSLRAPGSPGYCRSRPKGEAGRNREPPANRGACARRA